jgi:hypothetical protein
VPRSWLFLLAVLKAAGALGLLIGIGSPGFLVPTGRRTTRNGGRPAQLYRRGKATLLNPPITR